MYKELKDDFLFSLYAQGKNDYEVAGIVHVGRNRLRAWRERHGIASRTNKKNLDDCFLVRAQSLLEKGYGLSCIGEKLGVHRTSIARLFKKHGIEYPSRNRSVPSWIKKYGLSPTQVSVLVGDMFGDGGLVRSGPYSAYYQCGHSLSQCGFLDWKYDIFTPLSCRRVPVKIRDKRTGKLHSSISMATWSTQELYHWWDRFYPSGSGCKVPSGDLVEHLDWLGMAVWFMGDGKRQKNNYYFSVGLQVDVPEVVDALNRKFDRMFSCKKYSKEWLIKVEQRDIFRRDIKRYLLPLFRYKIEKSVSIE